MRNPLLRYMISSGLMISKHSLLVLLVVFLLPRIPAHSTPRGCKNACPSQHSFQTFPYPLGFSSGCAIPLNCTPAGGILIGEYPVQSINSESIIIAVKSQCNRPLKSLLQLFTHNYAPISRNTILLQNCSSEKDSTCLIPTTMVQDSSPCTGNFSCYSERTTIGFMSFQNFTKIPCKYLVLSITATAVSLAAEKIELGWWLEGDCQCSEDANCTRVESPIDKKPGYRCRCKEGFTGDGYLAGRGCEKVETGKFEEAVVIPATGQTEGKDVEEVMMKRKFKVCAAGVAFMVIYWFRRTLFSHKITIFWKNRSKSHQDFEAFLKSHGPLATKRYSYTDVKKMTNSFEEKLGQGGYGSVFKGMLQDKCLVAVKVLNETKGNGEEFINEVASISRTSHVNIVTLLGFCFEGSKRALVHEFMANGSLEKFIFENEAHLRDGNLQLSCEILHQIAVGVARGLEYLHRGCSTRILHFDIKPHNILLDENFFPKISDFGLAKICPKNENIVSMLGARGTIGYIAPEVIYRNFGAVSHKSDAYSFGMMVLEMVGGRRNVNVKVDQTSEIYFPHWIYKRLELNEDLALQSIRNEADKERIRQMVITSLWCIQQTLRIVQ